MLRKRIAARGNKRLASIQVLAGVSITIRQIDVGTNGIRASGARSLYGTFTHDYSAAAHGRLRMSWVYQIAISIRIEC
jgi:hypothetical protein